MSFLGGLLPFMSSEGGQETDDGEEKQDVRMFKRLGLAAQPGDGDESRR